MLTLTASILAEMTSTIEKLGAKPLFLYFPIGKEMLSTSTSFLPTEKVFFRFCKVLSVTCQSIRPAFVRAIASGTQFDPRRHWDARAHLIVARSIEEICRTGMLNSACRLLV